VATTIMDAIHFMCELNTDGKLLEQQQLPNDRSHTKRRSHANHLRA
jgi:hypothetical protein